MHKHWPKTDPYYEQAPTCKLTVKACDERLYDAQAEAQVGLAASLAADGQTGRFRRDGGVFAQLVLMMAGERDTILNADGNESETPFTQRLLVAARRKLQPPPPGGAVV